MSSLLYSLRSFVLKTGEALQGIFSLSGAVTYKTASTQNVSFDPFAGKTNKYAESAIVHVSGTVACHVLFGTSAIAAADNEDFRVGMVTQTGSYFVVDSNKPYMRVVDSGTAGDIYVTEIY